jgi:hypothetical protein
LFIRRRGINDVYGLTVAVVSKSRADWLKPYQPTFSDSIAAIIGCGMLHLTDMDKIIKQNRAAPTLSTLVLGILFAWLRLLGFGRNMIVDIISQGDRKYLITILL